MFSSEFGAEVFLRFVDFALVFGYKVMIAICIRILLLLEPHFSNFEATLKILQRPSLFQTLNS